MAAVHACGGNSRSSNRAIRHGFTLVATGDFDGRGEWTFVQDGAFVDITYDWRLRAEKPLLRNLSVLLKPLFEANHRWAMAQRRREPEAGARAPARDVGVGRERRFRRRPGP